MFGPGATARAYVRVRKRQVAISVLSERTIFSSLLLLIALSAVPFGSVEPWWEGIFESAIFVLAAGCVIGSIHNRWRVPLLLVPIIGLIALGCLQLLPFWQTSPSQLPWAYRTISVNPFETKRFVFKLLAVALSLGMLLRYTTNHRRLLALVNTVILVGAASAVFGIVRHLLPEGTFTAIWDGKLQGQSFGQFPNRNHFALFMEMSLGPALGLSLFTVQGLKRYLYWAIAFLLFLVIITANSRGGIVSMLSQLGFLSWIFLGRALDRFPQKYNAAQKNRGALTFWIKSRRYAQRCILMLVLVGAAFFVVLWLGGEPVRNRLESLPSEFTRRTGEVENKASRRLEIWGATLGLIKEHPILGSGFGAYKTAVAGYVLGPNDWHPEQAHNEYLELVAGGGVIGGILAVWFLFVLIREAHRQLNESDRFRQAVCLGAVLGLVGVAIHSLVDFGLHVMANALVCCGLIALATAKIRHGETESQSLVF